MEYKPRPIKVATNLPPPPVLTREDLEAIDAEATVLRDAVNRATRNLEWLDGEDMCIRIR